MAGVYTKDKTVAETHMSLVGGRYYIPDAQHDRWLRVYSEELRLNECSMFMVERRTPVFKMFLDLDFQDQSEVTSDTVLQFVEIITSVFRSFFPDANTECVVLGSPCKVLATSVKTGVHLIWPHIHVTEKQALTMRLNAVALLERTLPPRTPVQNSIADVVDASVLCGNGLRMYGSHKAARCKCKDVNTCLVCDLGYIVENRPYTLSMVWDGALQPDRVATLLVDVYALVQLTTIRWLGPPTPGYRPPPTAMAATLPKRITPHQLEIVKTTGCAAVPRKRHFAVMDVTPTVRDTIETFLQRRLSAWVNLHVRDLSTRKESVCVHVGGEGSSYCINVGRAHTSSVVYFMFTSKGCSQMCFSKHGDCSKYRSPPFPLTQLLTTLLFPEVNNVEAQSVRIETELARPVLPPPPCIAGHHLTAREARARRLARDQQDAAVLLAVSQGH